MQTLWDMTDREAKLDALLASYPNTAEFLQAVQAAVERLYADDPTATPSVLEALDVAIDAAYEDEP